MIVETIPYAGFYDIGKNIMSVTVFEGIEVDIHKMREMIRGLREWYGGQNFCLLCDHIYKYSYTYEVLQELAKAKDLLGMAILVHGGLSYTMAHLHRLYLKNVNVFWVKAYAIQWLEQIINSNSVQLS